MRISKLLTLAGALMMGGLSGLAPYRTATAQDAPNSAKTARGGLLASTAHYRFEIFFYPTGLRVFPASAHGTPVDVSRLTGSATFTLPGAPKPFVYTLKGAPAVGGKAPESLDLSLDLSKVPASGAKVAFEIVDGTGGRASFTVPFELVPAASHPAAAPGNSPTAPSPRYTYSQGYNSPTAPSPRYTYSQGYYGQGYYPQYEQPAPVAATASHSTYAVPGTSGGAAARPLRDWSIGRDTPLAKPWLRPQD